MCCGCGGNGWDVVRLTSDDVPISRGTSGRYEAPVDSLRCNSSQRVDSTPSAVAHAQFEG